MWSIGWRHCAQAGSLPHRCRRATRIGDTSAIRGSTCSGRARLSTGASSASPAEHGVIEVAAHLTDVPIPRRVIVAERQAIQWMLADAATEIEVARTMLYKAAWLKEQGRNYNKEVAMAKMFATEAAQRIIDRAVQLHEKQAAVRNIRIEKALDRSLPEIDLDRNKIQQVFANLIMNARDAMPEGGTLVITSRLSRDGTGIEIVFTDTGVGIPEENLSKIFDPFFTTKSFGTGLGLAVSYGIVRQRGGTIEVQSQVGRGSSFLVRLPLEDTSGEISRRETNE